MLINHTPAGLMRMTSAEDIFQGRTMILMGGAPTIKDLPLQLLEQRGVLSAAINNAARHFRPVAWFSTDDPRGFEPQILLDPGIMKFAPIGHAETILADRPYRTMPNILFFLPVKDVPLGEMLDSNLRTPWYQNTLMASIVLAYHLGVRRLILGGSDFEFSTRVYAHEDGLAPHERELNRSLYAQQALDLKRLKPVFDKAGLTLMDCSVRSKLADVYPVLSFADAVALALVDFPKSMTDPRTLTHGTRFAPAEFKQHLNIPDLPVGAPGGAMEDT